MVLIDTPRAIIIRLETQNETKATAIKGTKIEEGSEFKAIFHYNIFKKPNTTFPNITMAKPSIINKEPIPPKALNLPGFL